MPAVGMRGEDAGGQPVVASALASSTASSASSTDVDDDDRAEGLRAGELGVGRDVGEHRRRVARRLRRRRRPARGRPRSTASSTRRVSRDSAHWLISGPITVVGIGGVADGQRRGPGREGAR